jgi:hypothetical protein
MRVSRCIYGAVRYVGAAGPTLKTRRLLGRYRLSGCAWGRRSQQPSSAYRTTCAFPKWVIGANAHFTTGEPDGKSNHTGAVGPSIPECSPDNPGHPGWQLARVMLRPSGRSMGFRMAAPNVLLMGYNGANNIGAEALLLADIQDIRAVLGPDAA